jgi:predicted signal transduction protein with EAL and GGDEF domain
VLRSVAQLSTDLGQSVAVEGIETSEQLELITACNAIDEGQGFLFSRPASAAQVRDLLNTSQATGFDMPKIVSYALPLTSHLDNTELRGEVTAGIV